jgi:hypothetical protein
MLDGAPLFRIEAVEIGYRWHGVLVLAMEDWTLPIVRVRNGCRALLRSDSCPSILSECYEQIKNNPLFPDLKAGAAANSV